MSKRILVVEDQPDGRQSDVMSAASTLAPYRYPKYATLRIGTEGNKGSLVRPGVTSRQILQELAEMIEETGSRSEEADRCRACER
jgi:hypothetical protein